ncbi:tetratricopeptide repeat protein [Paraliomyxa miuraensis]|uniref:tetratricopeptide repeat protein n=1 Tax=Paraliomyxa miuraensis TaxID=376150 RepID=UPI00224E9F46|nr:tetratricopeptide repeat protein [Paraliomyxa miuraensis]MCX4243789.1 tetratricopeptide repeat protein [Paraliomyxa miuraensis]
MGHRTEEILRVGGIDELIDRGLLADEEGDLDLAERILDEAGKRAGENQPRVLHLAGRVAWAHGDIERATGFLQQATDQKPDRADVYLDCARCLHLMGDDGLAEEQVRAALALPRLDESTEGDARVLLSRIRLEDGDAEEALEVLEGVSAALKEHALYLSALADVLVELERTNEALVLLERAVAAEPEDADYHYQRGLTQQAAGDLEGGATSMLRVLALETKLRGTTGAPTFQEIQVLRTQLEDAMEELPDPIMGLVASAPITVQAAATEEQVRAGADPRSPVFFVGRPKLEERDAELTGIVVARDVLLDEIDDEDEIAETLLVAMVEEITDFFGRDDLLFAEASA